VTIYTVLQGFIFLVTIAIAVLAIFIIYRYIAPRRTPAIRGEYAIAELSPVPINGIDQWLLMRGTDRRNPVLLFLHGGPGTAHIAIMRNYQKELEKHFVVVQWDQRGAGLSGMKPVDQTTFNREQFIADGLEVTKYLCERFKQPKIYLVGHSWGSGLGYSLAARYPEYYLAFAGLGQMSRNGEAMAYAETLRVARAANHRQAIEELMELGEPPYIKAPNVKGTLHKAQPGHEAFAGMLVRFKWSEKLGGDARYISITNLIIKELLLSSEYTLKEVFAWLKNKGHSIELMYEECNQNIDMYQEGIELKIPIFFLLGKWDLLTVPAGAEALMEAINAPVKKIFWFDAGHEIQWERTAEYQQAIIEAFTSIRSR
jgi:pimeloyl-ACP methyl ester carboxylesterase